MRRAKFHVCGRCKGLTIRGLDSDFAALTVTLDPRRVNGGRYVIWPGLVIHRPAVTPGRGYEVHDCNDPCPVFSIETEVSKVGEPMF
jgi:hypothetical protein